MFHGFIQFYTHQELLSENHVVNLPIYVYTPISIRSSSSFHTCKPVIEMTKNDYNPLCISSTIKRNHTIWSTLAPSNFETEGGKQHDSFTRPPHVGKSPWESKVRSFGLEFHFLMSSVLKAARPACVLGYSPGADVTSSLLAPTQIPY